MSTNNQMKYYDYAKTLSTEGVMTALIGGGGGKVLNLSNTNMLTLDFQVEHYGQHAILVQIHLKKQVCISLGVKPKDTQPNK